MYEMDYIAPITITVPTVSEGRLPQVMSNDHVRKKEQSVILIYYLGCSDA